jgi:sugar transferase (PEP-CTERM/EpsH1 system associated)
MRILYFSPRNVWPLLGGASLRDYYLSREIARLGPVHYFGICQPEDSLSSPPQLHFSAVTLAKRRHPYSAWNLLRGFFGPQPVSVLNYFDSRAAEQLRRVLAQGSFDAIQIEGIHLAGYLPIIRSAASRAALICDWHDIESELMRRYSAYEKDVLHRFYARRTIPLLRKFERQLLLECEAHLAVSQEEADKLHELVPDARVYVIENGVDTAYFSAGQGDGEPGFSSRNDIVFVGSMDFHANVDAATFFAYKCWPAIKAANPRLRFVVVGSRPAPEVRALEKLESVVVTGTVDDVRPYYAGALAAVVPLRIGGGTRLKILEAMAAAVPVVSTRLGAEGLDVTPGLNILLAESAAEFCAATSQLASNTQLWAHLARAGRKLVQARYDWSRAGSLLGEAYGVLLRSQVHA